jgi:hypothetical protein
MNILPQLMAVPVTAVRNVKRTSNWSSKCSFSQLQVELLRDDLISVPVCREYGMLPLSLTYAYVYSYRSNVSFIQWERPLMKVALQRTPPVAQCQPWQKIVVSILMSILMSIQMLSWRPLMEVALRLQRTLAHCQPWQNKVVSIPLLSRTLRNRKSYDATVLQSDCRDYGEL